MCECTVFAVRNKNITYTTGREYVAFHVLVL